MMRINPEYWGWRYLAHKSRSRGQYDRASLRCYFRAWHSSGDVNDLLSYALFRRDLGYRLPRRWQRLLLAGAGGLTLRRRWLAFALLLESDVDEQGQAAMSAVLLDASIDPSTLNPPSTLHLPAVLAFYHQQHGGETSALTPLQAKLLSVQQKQYDWRKELHAFLAGCVAGDGICVVGNAGIMRGARLAAGIDAHACVVRFNTFTSELTDQEDMGRKTDIWGVAPNYRSNVLAEGFRGRIMLSGPDVRYRLADWSGLSALVDLNMPVLTTPLSVWKQLVRELGAPPSIGMVFLAWLRNLLGSWRGVSVAGFGALLPECAVYHHTDASHKPSGRHNWVMEARLLQRWQHEGLTSLHG